MADETGAFHIKLDVFLNLISLPLPRITSHVKITLTFQSLFHSCTPSTHIDPLLERSLTKLSGMRLRGMNRVLFVCLTLWFAIIIVISILLINRILALRLASRYYLSQNEELEQEIYRQLLNNLILHALVNTCILFLAGLSLDKAIQEARY